MKTNNKKTIGKSLSVFLSLSVALSNPAPLLAESNTELPDETGNEINEERYIPVLQMTGTGIASYSVSIEEIETEDVSADPIHTYSIQTQYGYHLPSGDSIADRILVQSGNGIISDYSYEANGTSGSISIAQSHLLSDVMISIRAIKDTYVSSFADPLEKTSCSASVPTFMESYTAELSTPPGFDTASADQVTVQMGERTLVHGQEYSYDKISDSYSVLTIYEDVVQGDIKIYAPSVPHDYSDLLPGISVDNVSRGQRMILVPVSGIYNNENGVDKSITVSLYRNSDGALIDSITQEADPDSAAVFSFHSGLDPAVGYTYCVGYHVNGTDYYNTPGNYAVFGETTTLANPTAGEEFVEVNVTDANLFAVLNSAEDVADIPETQIICIYQNEELIQEVPAILSGKQISAFIHNLTPDTNYTFRIRENINTQLESEPTEILLNEPFSFTTRQMPVITKADYIVNADGVINFTANIENPDDADATVSFKVVSEEDTEEYLAEGDLTRSVSVGPINENTIYTVIPVIEADDMEIAYENLAESFIFLAEDLTITADPNVTTVLLKGRLPEGCSLESLTLTDANGTVAGKIEAVDQTDNGFVVKGSHLIPSTTYMITPLYLAQGQQIYGNPSYFTTKEAITLPDTNALTVSETTGTSAIVNAALNGYSDQNIDVLMLTVYGNEYEGTFTEDGMVRFEVDGLEHGSTNEAVLTLIVDEEELLANGSPATVTINTNSLPEIKELTRVSEDDSLGTKEDVIYTFHVGYSEDAIVSEEQKATLAVEIDSDSESYELEASEGDGSYTLVLKQNGTYTISVTDLFNSDIPISTSILVDKIDRTRPEAGETINVTKLSGGSNTELVSGLQNENFFNDSVTVSFNSYDPETEGDYTSGIEKIYYQYIPADGAVSEENWQEFAPGENAVIEPEGTGSVAIKVIDFAGNESDPVTYGNIVIDKTAPVLQLMIDSANRYQDTLGRDVYTTDLEIPIISYDEGIRDLKKIIISRDGMETTISEPDIFAKIADGQFSVLFDQSGIGEHTLEVIAIDQAGNAVTESLDFCFYHSPEEIQMNQNGNLYFDGESVQEGVDFLIDTGLDEAEITYSYRAQGEEEFVYGLPKDAGSYRIQAAIGEDTEHFYLPVTAFCNLFIRKADAPTAIHESGKYVYCVGSEGTASVDLNNLLPKDKGSATYELEIMDENEILTDAVISEDGILQYTVKAIDKNNLNSEADLTVHVVMKNYEDTEYSLHITYMECDHSGDTSEFVPSEDGSVHTRTCSVCGQTYETSEHDFGPDQKTEECTDCHIRNMLSDSVRENIKVESLTYSGTFMTPDIVIDGLIDGTDYELNVNEEYFAGVYTATAKGIGNYTGIIEIEWRILPASLTIIADENIRKECGDPDPIITYTVSGILGEDKAENIFTGALGREEGEEIGTYNINKGTLAITDNEIGQNYQLAGLIGTAFTIVPKPTPTATPIPTATPVPTATPIPTATPVQAVTYSNTSAVPTKAPSVQNSVNRRTNATPVPTTKPRATATPKPTATPTPTVTPTQTPTTTPTATPKSTSIPTEKPVETPKPTEVVTDTSSPTDTVKESETSGNNLPFWLVLAAAITGIPAAIFLKFKK